MASRQSDRLGNGRGEPPLGLSVVEATLTELLVDPLADARHVLLAEEQRPLHREAAAVLAKHREEGRQVSRSQSEVNMNTGRQIFPAAISLAAV